MGELDSLLPNGRGVWIPIDHGVSDYPVQGLENLESLIRELSQANADAIVAQKGVVSRFGHLHQGHMVAHLSVSTRHAGDDSTNKILVGTVEESTRRGAAGVSVQVNMGSLNEAAMIERLGIVSNDCHRLNVPLLGMIYPRGENLNIMPDDDTKAISHAARLAFEMGCDVVKTQWTGDASSFAKVCKSVPIPVLIAGGPSGASIEETLSIVYQAIRAGGAGVCMGRQVFSNDHPGKVVKALRAIVHDGLEVPDAIKVAGL